MFFKKKKIFTDIYKLNPYLNPFTFDTLYVQQTFLESMKKRISQNIDLFYS